MPTIAHHITALTFQIWTFGKTNPYLFDQLSTNKRYLNNELWLDSGVRTPTRQLFPGASNTTILGTRCGFDHDFPVFTTGCCNMICSAARPRLTQIRPQRHKNGGQWCSTRDPAGGIPPIRLHTCAKYVLIYIDFFVYPLYPVLAESGVSIALSALLPGPAHDTYRGHCSHPTWFVCVGWSVLR